MSNLFHILEERHQPHPVYALWDRARAEARERDRLPVVAVTGDDWRGRLLVVHEADLPALLSVRLDDVGRAR
ncbi:MAG TPA: hypothetical protein VFF52_19865 [Isosphaeraceae bacterium]|nr:hypothetical protein [Isosphaeraceae bacterium]